MCTRIRTYGYYNLNVTVLTPNDFNGNKLTVFQWFIVAPNANLFA